MCSPKNLSTPPQLSRRSFVGLGAAAYVSGLAPLRAQAEKRYDAIVIGAGLSGLHAAMILEEQGLNVLTLEGRDRIGGRVYTLMDVPGRPEAAGEFIGASYARMIDTAQRLNMELVKPNPLGAGAGQYYHIKGQNILAEEWPEHALNPLEGEDRSILPNRMLFQLSLRNNPLLDQPDDAWLSEEFRKFDIPQTEFLRKYAGLNEETIRLMDVIIHADHMETTSALHECRRYALAANNSRRFAGSAGALQVKGGNSRLPLAMANSLSNGVLLNKTVYAMEDHGEGVTVHCGDGTKYTAGQVVCSMPYPVMRHVRFFPLLPTRMARAITEIDYGISIQVHYLIKKKFWEDDGLPSSIWSDSPFERFAILHRAEDGGPSSAIAYINGKEASKYDFMTDAQVAEYTTRELIKVRPSIEGALEPIKIQSCHRNVHGAGDWVYWKPGQVTEFASHMREPHGNIHFAGEHTAVIARGMEGAFESGERAAFDALMRI